MLLTPNLYEVIKKLPLTIESDHFIVHFGLRNPIDGRGLGPGGVRDRVLVLNVLYALERLHNTMTDSPWNRDKPEVGAGGRTHVYLSDSSPFTATDGQGIPFINLPCRNNDPTTQAEIRRAAAEAVHEATHVFNHRKRPFIDLFTDPWVWFDEGMALFMETLVVPGNPDYCRFLMNWIDMPEISLDDIHAKYQAGMFIRYLSKRIGNEFINDVWTKSRETEKPLEALVRLMPAGKIFLSHDPSVKDIFASGYCLDSYFLSDHGRAFLSPEVFIRYGERAVSESAVLKPDSIWEIMDSLDHLACRYYRFYLKGQVPKLRVSLRASDSNGVAPLKAEMATVILEMQRGEVKPLQITSSSESGEALEVFAEMDIQDSEGIDHIVLVVTNCGIKANHDDGKEYTITASAL
ncbi:MAG: DUF6055 domain-containing protein [Blastocatellia bacterium]|nr:DUF6055 domain-containing protein [Blastocatellia bacterium]